MRGLDVVSEAFEGELDKFLLTVNKCTDINPAESCTTNNIDDALSKIQVNIILVSQEFLSEENFKNLTLDNESFNSLSTTEVVFLSPTLSTVSRNYIGKSNITKDNDVILGTDFLFRKEDYTQYGVFD